MSVLESLIGMEYDIVNEGKETILIEVFYKDHWFEVEYFKKVGIIQVCLLDDAKENIRVSVDLPAKRMSKAVFDELLEVKDKL